jgi:16S rRNA (guanine527-N7)-methyltransferase
MSPPGRPKGELLPLGGTARSAKGAQVSTPRQLQWAPTSVEIQAQSVDRALFLRISAGIDALEAGAPGTLGLPANAAERLAAYVALLAKWNRTYNLTAIREPDRMVTHHVLDSLAVLPHLPSAPALRLLDVGSGGGVPGIPLAIARPGWQVTTIDSSHKKCTFVRQAAIELALSNVTVVTARVEEFRPHAPFDIVISRAFSDLATFGETSARHLAPGGRLVAMKGVHPDEELAQIPPGLRVVATPALTVPGLDAERHLVILEHAEEALR